MMEPKWERSAEAFVVRPSSSSVASLVIGDMEHVVRGTRAYQSVVVSRR